MRRFLLYVHTGRRAALDAMLAVLVELADRQVEAVLMADQVAEIRALPAEDVPDGLLQALDPQRVDARGVIEAGDRVELGIVLGAMAPSCAPWRPCAMPTSPSTA